MKRRAKEKTNLEQVSQAVLLSAAECARLCGVRRRESSDELNEQIGKFLGYLYDGFKRGGSLWAQFEAELRAVYSERQAKAIDYTVLHPANRKKDLT
jgi:hypothetical protein